VRGLTILPTSLRITIAGTDYAINLYTERYSTPETTLDGDSLGRADEMCILDGKTGRFVGIALSRWGVDEWSVTRHADHPQHVTINADDVESGLGELVLLAADTWTSTQVASYLKLGSARAARTQLDRWGLEACERDLQSGEKLYLAAAVISAAKHRPGRGARTDLQPDTAG
jgi:hypothetical protein